MAERERLQARGGSTSSTSTPRPSPRGAGRTGERVGGRGEPQAFDSDIHASELQVRALARRCSMDGPACIEEEPNTTVEGSPCGGLCGGRREGGEGRAPRCTDAAARSFCSGSADACLGWRMSCRHGGGPWKVTHELRYQNIGVALALGRKEDVDSAWRRRPRAARGATATARCSVRQENGVSTFSSPPSYQLRAGSRRGQRSPRRRSALKEAKVDACRWGDPRATT